MAEINPVNYNLYDFTDFNPVKLSESGIAPKYGSAICIATNYEKYIFVASKFTSSDLSLPEERPLALVANTEDTDPETDSITAEIDKLFLAQDRFYRGLITRLVLTSGNENPKRAHKLVNLWLPLHAGHPVSISRIEDSVVSAPTELDGVLKTAQLAISKT